MHIEITDEKYSRKQTIIHIIILLGFALIIGVYLASSMVLIAKDGATFISYAKGIESHPIETIKGEFQHPGYPFLVFAVHKIAEAGNYGSSALSWIYSAQAATLIFRLQAVVILYFLGAKIAGQRLSFWAVLILIFLPNAAKYGSDALSDWPAIFFLSAGFLLLIWGAERMKWWVFGFAGLAAGMGYLIRPECAQVVVLGTLWLGMQTFCPKGVISRYKAALAFVLLAVGFFAAAGPYMKLKGEIFPKKQLVEFTSNTPSSEIYKQEIQTGPKDVYAASFAPSDIAGAFGKVVQRVGEMLMWFFMPALLIGIYEYFRRGDWRKPEKFFVIALIALNVIIMTLLYCKYGYMSRRHILPLVVFTIFYVPLGLEALARWLGEKLSDKANTDFWFLVLFVIGVSICGLKMLRMEEQSRRDTAYKNAALWLAKNTCEEDVIAVPDGRIGLYSSRRSIQYDEVIPKEAQYVVKVLKDEKDTPSDKETIDVKEVFSIEKGDRKSKVIIYKQEQF
ncbi:MAG: glycosyltransferase family 39 protein [Sedimentisphaerales bacterium]|nr:glycosyltransferase family 39 protein [Sedimentisphaerales bacterium]